MWKKNSLFMNSIYNILYKSLNVIFPLITSIYASRILMSEGIGKVTSAQNIVLYFTTVASLGIPTYGVKKISEYRNDMPKLSKSFWELFIINFSSSIFCTIIYYSLILTIDFFAPRKVLYSVCGLNILFNIFNVDWFYQGIEEYRYIMLRSFSVKIISLLLLFCFVRSADDYVYYALISSFALVFNYVFNIINIRKYLCSISGSLEIFNHLKPIFMLLASAIAVEVYTLTDTTMLTVLCGDEIVGLYSVSMKIIKIIRGLIVAICAVYLPKLSFYYAHGQIEQFNVLIERGIKILFVLTLPTTLGIILVSELMMPILFGESFINAIVTTDILSFSIITVAFSNFMGHQVLITIGKEKKILHSTVLGAGINIFFNVPLIILLQHHGAAIASAVTEGCVAAYQYYIVKKFIKIEMSNRFVMSTIVGLLCMSISVILTRKIILFPVLQLIASCLVGLVVYMSVMVWLKNEIICDVKCRCCNKLKKRNS